MEALRPAWASWMPGTAPCSPMKRAIGAKAAAWASDQMPLSSGLIRPSGLTALASTMTSPAPPTARLPRWTRCQSVGSPSRLEYWHMGDDEDAVAEGHIAQFQRGEKPAHRPTVFIISSG